MGNKNHPERQLGSVARERIRPFQEDSFPSDKQGVSKDASEELVQAPEGPEAHRRQKKRLSGAVLMAMHSGSNKTCTIHHKDGVKATPQNVLERTFIITPPGTQVSSALSSSTSAGGTTTGTGPSGSTSRQTRRSKSYTGFGDVSPREAGGPGWVFFFWHPSRSAIREGQRGTLSSPKGSRWAATTPNRPWEICTKEAAICALPSQNTPPSPVELH